MDEIQVEEQLSDEENARVSNSVQNSMSEMLELSGSSGFRQRLALSLVANQPVKMSDLRARDAVVPGLRPSEGCIIELAQLLSENLRIHFGGGHACTDLTISNPGLLNGLSKPTRVECPLDRGLSYYLEFLLMLGPFTKSGIRELTLEGVTDHPLDISIDTFRTGLLGAWKAFGGHSADAPLPGDEKSGDNVVVLSSLNSSLPDVELRINSRGLLPNGGGSVTITCGIFNRRQGSLQPQRFIYAGRVCRIRGVAFTCHMNPIYATRTLEAAREVMNHLLADVHIYTDIAKGDKAGRSPGFGLSLTAETVKGCLYTADGVVDRLSEAELDPDSPLQLVRDNSRVVDYVGGVFGGSEQKWNVAETKRIEDLLAAAPSAAERKTGGDCGDLAAILGHDVALRLLADIAEGGFVSASFQWLALYFLAFADDHKRSRLVLGRLTPNTVMMLRSLKQFLGVEFTVETYTTVVPPVPDSKPTSPLEQLRQENRFVLSCRGVGYNNISRPTF